MAEMFNSYNLIEFRNKKRLKMEDMTTTQAQGVTLRSGTVIRPKSEIGTPRFHDATDLQTSQQPEAEEEREETKANDVPSSPSPLTAAVLLKRERDSSSYPNYSDDRTPIHESASKTDKAAHTKVIRDY